MVEIQHSSTFCSQSTHQLGIERTLLVGYHIVSHLTVYIVPRYWGLLFTIVLYSPPVALEHFTFNYTWTRLKCLQSQVLLTSHRKAFKSTISNPQCQATLQLIRAAISLATQIFTQVHLHTRRPLQRSWNRGRLWPRKLIFLLWLNTTRYVATAFNNWIQEVIDSFVLRKGFHFSDGSCRRSH